MAKLRHVHSTLVAAAAALTIAAHAHDASAQLVVYDPATVAENRIVAFLKEQLHLAQLAQHTKIRAMARRLSALNTLRRYVLANVPRWRVHGSASFLFAPGYLDALTFGDPTGASYAALADALPPSARIGQLPALARRAITSRLASVDLIDAAAIASTHYSGQLRFGGRRELNAIDALEADVVDESVDQSATAVLDKISGATLIGARQRQARIQLLAGLLEQLLVDNKRARDTDASALGMQIVTWRDKPAADQAFRAGAGDALRTWRQP